MKVLTATYLCPTINMGFQVASDFLPNKSLSKTALILTKEIESGEYWLNYNMFTVLGGEYIPDAGEIVVQNATWNDVVKQFFMENITFHEDLVRDGIIDFN